MTPADAVLLDLLREAGFERLSPWHLLCVEAYLAQAPDRSTPYGDADLCEWRLVDDLAGTLDELHEAALAEDEQRAAMQQLEAAVRRTMR